jgi:hypothetical protein
LVLTLAFSFLKKAPVVGSAKRNKQASLTAREFFTASQYKQLFPIAESKYDANRPPAGFALNATQIRNLQDSGYESCVGTDGTTAQNGGPACFCEQSPVVRAVFDDSRSIIQPWNTWSALAFSLVGLVILGSLVWQWYPGNAPGQDNLMTNNYFYAMFYAYLVIFLGPASMAFHIGMRNIGGWADSFSIHLLFGFTLVYNIVRLWMRDWEYQRLLFLAWFGGSTVIVEFICSPWILPGARLPFDIGIGIASLGLQLFIFIRQWSAWWRSDVTALRGRIPPGGGWWFIAATIAFGLAFLVWVLSWTQKPLCFPEGFQGHAVWHVLSGLAGGFLYLYFRQEGEPKLVETTG